VPNRRYLKLAPDGTPRGTVPFPALPEGDASLGHSPPRAADKAGRVYFDSPIVAMRPAVKRQQRARILRFTPGEPAAEAVADFADHADFEHHFRYRAFPQTDAWVVDDAGRIGVLSAAEYRLRWYEGGQVVKTGPVIPYSRVRVGAGERERFWAQKAVEPASGASVAGGRPQLTPAGMERTRAAWPDSLFPEFLPPFDPRGVFRTEDGSIWVTRTTPASSPQRIDILNGDGALRAFLTLPEGRRLIAVGRTDVYLLAVDGDGVQSLERYRLPR
jgi:hypothetical protein